jgi:hypothetical protein
VLLPELIARVNASFVPGFEVVAGLLTDQRLASLQEVVTATTWEIRLPGLAVDELERAVSRVIEAPSLPLERERKGTTRIDDVRPAIVRLELDSQFHDGGFEPVLIADINTEGRGLRPSELVEVTLPDLDDLVRDRVRLRRTHQWMSPDGARQELLPLDAAVGALTGRVSV